MKKEVGRVLVRVGKAGNHREHTPQPDLSSEYKMAMAQAGAATFFQCARWKNETPNGATDLTLEDAPITLEKALNASRGSVVTASKVQAMNSKLVVHTRGRDDGRFIENWPHYRVSAPL